MSWNIEEGRSIESPYKWGMKIRYNSWNLESRGGKLKLYGWRIDKPWLEMVGWGRDLLGGFPYINMAGDRHGRIVVRVELTDLPGPSFDGPGCSQWRLQEQVQPTTCECRSRRPGWPPPPSCPGCPRRPAPAGPGPGQGHTSRSCSVVSFFCPDNSRQFQTIPDNSRRFRTIPDNSGQFRIIPDNSRQFQPHLLEVVGCLGGEIDPLQQHGGGCGEGSEMMK